MAKHYINPDMVANSLVPFEPVHPGLVLRDELESRGISQRSLAAKMDVPPSQLNEIINGKRNLTAEYALMIEALLGIPAVPLLRMQTDYNLQSARMNKSLIDKLKSLASIAAAL